MSNFKVTVEIEARDPSDEHDAEFGAGPWSEVVYLSANSEQEAGNKALDDRLRFYTDRDGIPYGGTIIAVHEQVAP